MLYIVTPVSRPENLREIAKSIPYKEGIKWIIIFDAAVPFKTQCFPLGKDSLNVLDKKHIMVFPSPIKNACVGHAHRNHFINKIYPDFSKKKDQIDYVYFLDDDTILHPDFLDNILPIFEVTFKTPSAIIFDQLHANGAIRLKADINNVKVCNIDMGQYIFNLNDLPENIRFKEDDYCADGIFIEEFFNHVGKEKFMVINKPLSYYNFLR